jgi:hypothetical protein
MLRNSWAAGEMWLAMVRPLDHGHGRSRMCLSGNQRAFQVRQGGSWLDRCWGARGRPSSHGQGRHPGGAKSGRPSADALAWPSEEGDRRSATATRTSTDRGPLRHHAPGHCYGCPDWWGIGSEQRDVLPTAMTPSSWWDRQFGAVNGFPWVYQHRNGNDGLRVLLGTPDHRGVGERPSKA